jgi:hypothetical protein
MTYSTSAPPILLVQGGVGNQFPAQWAYNSTDAGSAVDASGYITNAKALGMKVGDLVYVTDTDASPPAVTVHRVVTISSTWPGAADLADGVALGSTNSD